MTARLLTDKEIREAIVILSRTYPGAECALHFGSVFQLLISVMLSAQTTDVSVNKVSPAFFARWPDATALAGADVTEVSETIRTIGMYRQKASNAVRMAQMLLEDFGGEVPQDFEALQTFPGVGRKTANVVLWLASGSSVSRSIRMSFASRTASDSARSRHRKRRSLL